MSREIDQMYGKSLGQRHNIQEHLGFLKGLALECETVTEFGFRSGTSTVALLAGGAKVTSYDIKMWPRVKSLRKIVPQRFKFVQGDTRKVTIEPCDMLFIDTWHTEDQVYAELKRHHDKVKKWIALHDTKTFGRQGEDKKSRGLMFGIERFLEEHEEWKIMLAFRHCHGFMVLWRWQEG